MRKSEEAEFRFSTTIMSAPNVYIKPYVHVVRPEGCVRPKKKTKKKKITNNNNTFDEAFCVKEKASEKRDAVSSSLYACIMLLFPGCTVANIKEAQHDLEAAGTTVTSELLIDRLDENRKVKDEELYASIYEVNAAKGLTCETEESEEEYEEEEEEEETGLYVETEEDARKYKYQRAVEKKKMELRNKIDAMQMMCKVCNCSEATILLLPCGHLVCCDDCLMDVRRCPVNRCNKVVRGTKEVFFS